MSKGERMKDSGKEKKREERDKSKPRKGYLIVKRDKGKVKQTRTDRKMNMHRYTDSQGY